MGTSALQIHQFYFSEALRCGSLKVFPPGGSALMILPVSIDYLYDVEEIAGVRPVRAVCEGTAVLRSTSTHSLGVRLEEA